MCGIETIDNLDRRCTRFMYPSFPPKRDLGPPGGRERVVGTSSQPACCFKLQRIKAASRPVLPVAYTQPNWPSSPGCQGGKQILPEPDKCPNNNMGQHPGRSFLAAASRRSALRNEKRVPRGTKFREDYLRAAGPCLSPPPTPGHFRLVPFLSPFSLARDGPLPPPAPCLPSSRWSVPLALLFRLVAFRRASRWFESGLFFPFSSLALVPRSPFPSGALLLRLPPAASVVRSPSSRRRAWMPPVVPT